MLDFHPLDEAFVQRRLRETLAEYAQQRVINVDDIGMGAFMRRLDDSAAPGLSMNPKTPVWEAPP